MPTIRTLPTPPNQSRPKTFADDMDDFLEALPGWTDDVNSYGATVGLGVVGRSTTPLTIGEGEHVLEADAGKGWFPGQGLIFAIRTDPLKQMLVIVETYDGETGDMTGNTPLGQTAGTGSSSDWIIGPAPASPQTSKASAAEIWAHLDDSKYMTSKGFADAAAFQPLTDGATIAINASGGFGFTVVLGGNRTFGAPTGMYDGQPILIEFDCNGYTPAWNNVFDWGIANVPVPLTTAGKYHYVWATWRSARSKWVANYRAPG